MTDHSEPKANRTEEIIAKVERKEFLALEFCIMNNLDKKEIAPELFNLLKNFEKCLKRETTEELLKIINGTMEYEHMIKEIKKIGGLE